METRPTEVTVNRKLAEVLLLAMFTTPEEVAMARIGS